MEDDEYERKPLYYDPPYRPISPSCGRCTHWHALTTRNGSDKDAIIGVLRCDGRTPLAQRICANLGVCGYMVDRAETYDEPQQWYLTAFDGEPTKWCDFIDRSEVDG